MAEDLIIRHTISSLGDAAISLHLTHLLCLEGSAVIKFNTRDFSIEKGGCCIIRATWYSALPNNNQNLAAFR